MAYIVGTMIGGTIIVTLLALLIGRLFFKRERPTPKALKSALNAFAIAAILAGFGFADGGSFAWWAGLYYIIPAGIAFALLHRRYSKRWEPIEEVFGGDPIRRKTIRMGDET